ncbi:phospho-N-acetylmuramoyl-pentapeptide-transferase [Coprothermobacteraceae bacterium]|nr:phospho-N-acetylmuramoyl-pentapeptide-transferase [Coprothermobacteraceae bacterium]
MSAVLRFESHWSYLLLVALTAGLLVFALARYLGVRAQFYPKRIREFYEKQEKALVPLSGGFGFLLAGVLVYALFLDKAILVATLAGLVGLLDDVFKVRRKGKGIKARTKLLGLVLVALTFRYLGFDWLRTAWAFVVLLSTTSATNFTDGVDGLLGTITIPVLLVLPKTPANAVLLGVVISYLVYNVSPATIFMGDTGSYFIGGYLAATMLFNNEEWWLFALCFVGVLEVVSVVLQVAYFRLTGGKRLFRMTPLHHHFQKLGWSDPRIVFAFAAVQTIAAVVYLVR